MSMSGHGAVRRFGMRSAAVLTFLGVVVAPASAAHAAAVVELHGTSANGATVPVKTLDRHIVQVKTLDRHIVQVKTLDRHIVQVKTLDRKVFRVKTLDRAVPKFLRVKTLD